jgi:uncharacterized protein YeaC (DUF1315 family)
MEMVAPKAGTVMTPTSFRKASDTSIENILLLAIAKKERVKPEDIFITKIEEKTWPDGCLGLPQKREKCTQALMPGYRIEALVKGKTTIFRSDASGSVIQKEK